MCRQQHKYAALPLVCVCVCSSDCTNTNHNNGMWFLGFVVRAISIRRCPPITDDELLHNIVRRRRRRRSVRQTLFTETRDVKVQSIFCPHHALHKQLQRHSSAASLAVAAAHIN